MNNNQLETLPGMRWIVRHPRLAAWFVLSLGMIVLLLIEARDVGLLVTQWGALIVATILVAGLCVWIVSWEDSTSGDTLPTEPPTNPNPDTVTTTDPAGDQAAES